MKKPLTPEQDKIVEKEVNILKEIKQTLKKLQISGSDLQLIDRSLQQLQDLFLLVIVGEFNSGKSSTLNALLGKNYLKDGVTPTTSKINYIRYGETFSSVDIDTNNLLVNIPVDWLKEISLVDTPGTNAVIRGHEQITKEFVPRSDLVLFITSVDRAFSESERQFLQNIEQYRKKIICILSKIDILETENEINEVIQFLKNSFKGLLGIEPIIFPVSSKLALRAKLQTESKAGEKLEDNPMWQRSRFEELEKFILKTLTEEERTRLKLENPLGIGAHLVQKYRQFIQEKLNTQLKQDSETLEYINKHIQTFLTDLKKDFSFQHDRLDNVLLRLAKRGNDFFDEKLTFTNILGLLRGETIKQAFEKDVVADTSQQIATSASDLIDWLMEKNSRLWKDILDYMQRKTESKTLLDFTFEYNRAELVRSMGKSATDVVNEYDKEKEANRLLNEIKSTLVTTVAIEVSAVGLGTILATSLLDITGITAAGVLAATGLAVIPYKRASLKESFQNKINDLRTKLKSTMNSHFEHEVTNKITKLQSVIEPFSKLVTTEKQTCEEALQKLSEIEEQLKELELLLQSSFKK